MGGGSEVFYRFSHRVFRALVPEKSALQVKFVRFDVLCSLFLNAPLVSWQELYLQRFYDVVRYLFLDREYVLDLSLVVLGPNMFVVLNIDQLDGYPELVCGFSYAPF